MLHTHLRLFCGDIIFAFYTKYLTAGTSGLAYSPPHHITIDMVLLSLLYLPFLLQPYAETCGLAPLRTHIISLHIWAFSLDECN